MLGQNYCQKTGLESTHYKKSQTVFLKASLSPSACYWPIPGKSWTKNQNFEPEKCTKFYKSIFIFTSPSPLRVNQVGKPWLKIPQPYQLEKYYFPKNLARASSISLGFSIGNTIVFSSWTSFAEYKAMVTWFDAPRNPPLRHPRTNDYKYINALNYKNKEKRMLNKEILKYANYILKT